MNLFISCAIGLEPVLHTELDQLFQGALELKPTKAGVWVEGDIENAYQVVLWSRVASRVLLPIFECDATVDELFHSALEQNWSDYLYPGAAVAIDFSGINKHIRHTRFGALKIKDALVDWHNARSLELPTLEKDYPDVRLSARISKDKVSVALDFSGQAMHRRGYRERQGVAPLRENLAASLLYRAKWPEIARAGGNLLDPMCGSGTIVIEAALMACDAAPGLRRNHDGFKYWPQHDQDLWFKLIDDAEERFKIGRESYKGRLYGSDGNSYMVKMARDNASRAAVQDVVEFDTEDALYVRPPEGLANHEQDYEQDQSENDSQEPSPKNLLITNPPYGERLSDKAEVVQLYERFGENLLANFSGWSAAILAASADFGHCLGMHSHKQYKVDNGTLACMLLLIDIKSINQITKKDDIRPSEGAIMVANRIKKNLARLKSWLGRESINAYRVYDADMPEYSAAVDIYKTDEGRVAVVQEYAAPKTIEATKARHRFNELLTGVRVALDLKEDQIHVKSRERQRGTSQYQRSTDEYSDSSIVIEGRAQVEVNFEDYLDTGLFLDHRPIRREINKMAAGKSVLNLFCYTSVVTVQAALGGAKRTLSVDMSNTYLDWSERNFRHNDLDLSTNRLMREDCLKFLQTQSVAPDEKFDLIFLDPPSFSNSKRMEEVLDIQRDHVKLIEQSLKLLEKDGMLIFSTNLRKFKMDTDALQGLEVEDYSEASLDPDFKRNHRIHKCWKIRFPAKKSES